jgi:hypothetical protein
MGYYDYLNSTLFIKTHFDHPQGGGYAKAELKVKQVNDTLELISKDYLKKYKIIDLPKGFLIYKPDW